LGNSRATRILSSCSCCNTNPLVSAGRRTLLSGLIAGVSARIITLATSALARTAVAPRPALIDVHHHIVPPFYLAENREHLAGPTGQINPAWTNWEPKKALDAMDEHGVATAVLSLSTPGVWFGNAEAARRTARRCNEYAAELIQTYPRRFGQFAVIPLPDSEGSLREIEYALDVLKADGIGLLTSYGDKWLGDPTFLPVFEELNRRKSVVFVHPTVPGCCQKLLPAVSPLVAEIPQDTTRAVTNLLFTGSFSRFKDIRFIFTHAGGTVPMVVGRMQQYGPKGLTDNGFSAIEDALRRLYFDIAGTAYAPAIAALTALVPTTQILFGSDNPYVPLGLTANGLAQLGLSAADLQAIGHDNALTLLPNLARS
jgi:predicted TIM-barrel fold metal-dependent hydrolase